MIGIWIPSFKDVSLNLTDKDQSEPLLISEPRSDGIINQIYVKTTKRQDSVDLAVCFSAVNEHEPFWGIMPAHIS
jgi:hypothetical protein